MPIVLYALNVQNELNARRIRRVMLCCLYDCIRFCIMVLCLICDTCHMLCILLLHDCYMMLYFVYQNSELCYTENTSSIRFFFSENRPPSKDAKLNLCILYDLLYSFTCFLLVLYVFFFVTPFLYVFYTIFI